MHHWLWYSFLTALNTVGLIVGLAAIRAPLALAPPIEMSSPSTPSFDKAQSITQLYQLRDRLQQELEESASSTSSTLEPIQGSNATSDLVQVIQTLEIRIHLEEKAEASFKAAQQLAGEAVTRGQQLGSLDRLVEAQSYWKAAIATLDSIPQDTFIAPTAQQKRSEYQQYLHAINHQINLARSSFLEAIANRIGNPEDVLITVCQVSSRECRHWQGNVPPASPASLIKVPVAIALAEKVAQEEAISLETKIAVTSSNYTEDPEGANIWPGEEYTLRELLLRMIDHSSNIATNQLIDYLGRDYINQVIQELGYQNTRVDFKLVGEYTYPDDMGEAPNQSTTDDLTAMMLSIYNQDRPHYDAILDALVRQTDWELGYQALNDSPGRWVGEKTGQNNRAIGTTVAVNLGGLDGERYIITLIQNYTGDPEPLRQGIREIVNYIAQNGGF